MATVESLEKQSVTPNLTHDDPGIQYEPKPKQWDFSKADKNERQNAQDSDWHLQPQRLSAMEQQKQKRHKRTEVKMIGLLKLANECS